MIITIGKNGIYLKTKDFDQIIPAIKVTPIDSTAAGDVFNGAVVAALGLGKGWISACEFACKAAAISVTRLGAQSSAPYQHEIN